MGFETGLENGERVNVVDVWLEGVQEAGSGAAKGSRSHGGQAGRWIVEEDLRGREGGSMWLAAE